MATNLTHDAQSEDLMEDGLGTLHRKALTILKRIRDGALDPETGQKRGPTYSISKAASLVGRTASAIREAERDAAPVGRESRLKEIRLGNRHDLRMSSAIRDRER